MIGAETVQKSEEERRGNEKHWRQIVSAGAAPRAEQEFGRKREQELLVASEKLHALTAECHEGTRRTGRHEEKSFVAFVRFVDFVS